MTVDERLTRGREEDYLLIEELVRSDQLPADALAMLLARHPKFHDWLKARALERQAQGERIQ
jgi:hypothetical protein